MTTRIEVPSDHVRREARESQLEHASAMRNVRELLARLFSGESPESSEAKAAFAAPGVDRRGFFRIGGVAVAGAAVFAACGTDDAGEAAGEQEGEGAKEASAADITILRTASSLELAAVEVYQLAIDSGLVATTAVASAAELFQSQHQEHAEAFITATKQRGGEPFEEANPVLVAQLRPLAAALKDEAGAVRLAFDLENAAAATYYASAGEFDDLTLNQIAMSVGGVEARHVAVLAGVLGQPQVPRVFQTADGAFAAGTGV